MNNCDVTSENPKIQHSNTEVVMAMPVSGVSRSRLHVVILVAVVAVHQINLIFAQ